MTTVGIIFPPSLPPEHLREVARAADDAGIAELWLWEDCFAESGLAAAAVALEATTRITVAVGLFPVPLRNVALTAMEIATLDRLHPGRFLPAIGHGVLDWMAQVGARVASPLTLLREYTTALRRLLDGEEVTMRGRYVTLDAVALAWPPHGRVPLYIGAEGPKTLALAGELGDGFVAPTRVGASTMQSRVDIATAARRAAGIDAPLDNVVFLDVPAGIALDDLAARIADLGAAGAGHVALLARTEGAPNADVADLRRLLATAAGLR